MFHVPESARILNGPLRSDVRMGNNGAFFVPTLIAGRELWIIASDRMDWEHVSVHVANRANKLYVPNWAEMCYVKRLFWDAEDAVMQLHPPQSRWVNNHPTTLHLWRPIGREIPLPPDMLTGIKELGVVSAR